MQVPSLRFFLSPARVRRLMRILRASLPGKLSRQLLQPAMGTNQCPCCSLICTGLSVSLLWSAKPE